MQTQNVAWLLASDEPWTRYRTLADLMGEPEHDAAVQATRDEMLAHPDVQALQQAAAAWPGHAIKRHNDATLALYALTTLADFGVRADDLGMDSVIDQVLTSQSDEGAFRSRVQISKAFGGTGEAMWTWILCDSAPTLYALLAMGKGGDPAVQRGVEHLLNLVSENGWRCCAAEELGRFKGPGRREDPCPIANVWGLKALAAAGLWDCDAARAGVEMLLTHWELRGQKKYFLFGIGTDFHKLKYPFIWYDILHVADVLIRFPWARSDSRLIEMVMAVTAQADSDGRYTAASMYRAWKGWSFADKKRPSPWLTFLAYRLHHRMTEATA